MTSLSLCLMVNGNNNIAKMSNVAKAVYLVDITAGSWKMSCRELHLL